MNETRAAGSESRTPGGGHIHAPRRIFDAGLTSEESIAAARLRADARVARGDVGRDDRLAPARARLEAQGSEVVATVSQYASDTGVKNSNGVTVGPGHAGPKLSQGSVTPSTPRLAAQRKIGTSSATHGTIQTGAGDADVVTQPLFSKTVSPSGAIKRDFNPPSKLTAAETAYATSSQSFKVVKDSADRVAHQFAEAHKDLARRIAIAQNFDKITSGTNVNAGKKTPAPAQLKTPATDDSKETFGLGLTLDAAKKPEPDDGFDVVDSKGPSAANGSALPNVALIMEKLDKEFSPTLHGLQGWDDDDDETDDGEEWDMGGLAVWKWVGEKSAKKSKAVGRRV
jgi:hypothetical protein